MSVEMKAKVCEEVKKEWNGTRFRDGSLLH